MRILIAISLTLFITSCSLFQPKNEDLLFNEYENNPDYSTRKMGSYFVVLTFRPKTIYNNYLEDGNKFTWRIGDNEIIINNDRLSINKINFGDIMDSRVIKIDKGRVYVDGKYRRSVKK